MQQSLQDIWRFAAVIDDVGWVMEPWRDSDVSFIRREGQTFYNSFGDDRVIWFMWLGDNKFSHNIDPGPGGFERSIELTGHKV